MVCVDGGRVDLRDRLTCLLKQERRYLCVDYLAPQYQAKQAHFQARKTQIDVYSTAFSSCSSKSSSSCAGINEVWREKICEWTYQVIDHFDFNRELASISLSYLDRYLATRPVNRKMFQLAAMTALYLAIKIYEPSSHKLRMTSFIELSRGYFKTEHIISMEESILRALSWHVHPPTSLCFARHFTPLIEKSCHSPLVIHEVKEASRFMTELSVCDYYFTTHKPSSIGIAALLCAFSNVGGEHITPQIHQNFINDIREFSGIDTSCEEVQDCVARLQETYYQDPKAYEQPIAAEVEQERNSCGTSPVCVSDHPSSEVSKKKHCRGMTDSVNQGIKT